MPKIRTLFFDLDDTLYDNKNGLWCAIRDRMNDYIQRLLGLSPDETASLRRHYYLTYGTTLRGLQIHHAISPDEYLAYVHDLPLEKYIQPDPELKKMLSSLPQHKYIFTNADADHARRILSRLGVQDCFDGVIDIRALQYHCKPEPEAYQIALRLAGETEAKVCLLVDDSVRNLAMAHELGFITVLVGSDGLDAGVDYCISNIKQLPARIPDLWQS